MDSEAYGETTFFTLIAKLLTFLVLYAIYALIFLNLYKFDILISSFSFCLNVCVHTSSNNIVLILNDSIIPKCHFILDLQNIDSLLILSQSINYLYCNQWIMTAFTN